VDAATYTQAIMELGATCCTPRAPDCGACPWRSACGAHALGLAGQIPVAACRAPLPHHQEAAVVLRHRRRLLLVRRPAEGLLGGLWGFPRQRAAEGGEPQAAARTLARRHTGRRPPTLRPLTCINHAYSHFRITLHVFHGTLSGPPPPPPEGERWVATADLQGYPMPATDLAIVEALGRQTTDRG
jgi:A/G-specific adenine glycosylase